MASSFRTVSRNCNARLSGLPIDAQSCYEDRWRGQSVQGTPDLRPSANVNNRPIPFSPTSWGGSQGTSAFKINIDTGFESIEPTHESQNFTSIICLPNTVHCGRYWCALRMNWARITNQIFAA